MVRPAGMVAVIGLVTSLAFAAEDSPGSTSRMWSGDNADGVQAVKIDSQRRGIQVTLNGRENINRPRSIGITFFDAEGNKASFELKAMQPSNEPSRYHGTIPESQVARSQSFVGFEIQIPFGSKSAQTLRGKLRKMDP